MNTDCISPLAKKPRWTIPVSQPVARVSTTSGAASSSATLYGRPFEEMMRFRLRGKTHFYAVREPEGGFKTEVVGSED